MIIPGLGFSSWVGWLFGVFLFRLPWGYPKFTVKSIPAFLNFLYTPIFIFFNVDILYHVGESLRKASESEYRIGRVETIVIYFEYAELLISNGTMRFIFLWKGRKLADFLCRLKRYNNSQMRRCSPATKADCLVTTVVFLSTTGVCISLGLAQYQLGLGDSWIRDYLGSLAYSLLFTFLFLFPLMVPLQVAFSFIVAVSGYLMVIFQDYCKHVLDIVAEEKWPGMSVIGGSLQESEMSQKRVFFTDTTRKEMLARLEIIQEMFTLAQELLGPMLLILLAGSSISIVMKAYDVIIIDQHPILLAKNGCHILNYVCYFWVLQCGQRIVDKIEEWKGRLADTTVQLSEDTHPHEKRSLKDIMNAISVWNWQLTAAEFFVVNRGLASGVVSLIMTYVVVLVQLKFSDPA